VTVFEGAAGEPFVQRARDASRIVESCWANKTRRALLYPENLTANFFDLSSGEAGEILDKLRRFKIRLAIVCPPGAVRFSSRFSEILCDDLQVFDDREAACAWLDKS
jgi:hypothetical protein